MNTKNDNLFHFFSSFEKLSDNDKLLFILKSDDKYEDENKTVEFIDQLNRKFSEVNAYTITELKALGKKNVSKDWIAFKNEIFKKYNSLESKYALEKEIYKIGSKLKIFREELNISLEEFSKKSELSISTIKKVENDGRLLSLTTMQKYVNLGLEKKFKIEFY